MDVGDETKSEKVKECQWHVVPRVLNECCDMISTSWYDYSTTPYKSKVRGRMKREIGKNGKNAGIMIVLRLPMTFLIAR